MNPEEQQDALETLQREVSQIKQKIGKPTQTNVTQLVQPLDAVSKQTINGLIQFPVATRLKNTDAATAANYGVFFIADKTFRVTSVTEIHGTAGTDGGTVSLNIEKLTGTQAPDGGKVILTTAFSLKTTINTVQYGTLVTNDPIILLRGDRLCLKDAGVLTAVANLTVTVYLQPL